MKIKLQKETLINSVQWNKLVKKIHLKACK